MIVNKSRKPSKEKKLKYCLEPGCGKEFLGYAVAKYCDFHRVLKNRDYKPPVYSEVDINNVVFKHKYRDSKEIEMECGFPGCNKLYRILVIPKIHVYPKYCEYHRNAWKRGLEEKGE